MAASEVSLYLRAGFVGFIVVYTIGKPTSLNCGYLMKALVIDASRTYCRFIGSALGASGFQVEEVDGYLSALTACESTHYDLVCMSQLATQNECYGLSVRIRSIAVYSRTPIVMLTEANPQELLEKASAAGITDVFHKQDFPRLEAYLNHLSVQLGGAQSGRGRILCLSGDEAEFTACVTLLQNTGYEVEVVNHIENARQELMAEMDYDVLLLMQPQPSDTASSVINMVRQQPDPIGRLPILAFLSEQGVAGAENLYREGMDDYVTVPLFEAELLARVANLVTAQQLRRQLAIEQQKLQDQSIKDPLTSLYNRHYFMDAVMQRVSQSKRHQRELSLLVIDLDGFKSINDLHGHVLGDCVLQQVANILKDCSRKEDVVGRYGGQDFFVLLDNCNLKQATLKAEQIRTAIEQRKLNDISLTASFGVSVFLRDEDDFSSFLERADEALLCAKKRGRNRVHSNPCL